MSERLHLDRGHPDTSSGKTHVLCVGNETTGDRWREVARADSAADAQRICDGWNAADELAALRALIAELVSALAGPDPEMAEILGPLSWLREAIRELQDRGPAEDEDDPDAYWTMVNEIEALESKGRAALTRAHEQSDEGGGT